MAAPGGADDLAAQELNVQADPLPLLALIIATGWPRLSTYVTATRGTDLGTLSISAWKARPKNGTADVDPCARAAIARSGELPVGTGDGIAFSYHRRQEEAARRALRRGGQRRHARGTVLDADTVPDQRTSVSSSLQRCDTSREIILAPTDRSISISHRGRAPATGCRPKATSDAMH